MYNYLHATKSSAAAIKSLLKPTSSSCGYATLPTPPLSLSEGLLITAVHATCHNKMIPALQGNPLSKAILVLTMINLGKQHNTSPLKVPVTHC